MNILQGLLLFAFFYSSSVCFGAEPLEPSAHPASRVDALVSVPQQLKKDLREVEALCWMRFSLNKALWFASDEDYRLGVENDMAFYVKANKILKLINTDSFELSAHVDKLNRNCIDKLYGEVSIYLHNRTEQERVERIAYKDLIREKKKEKGRGPMMSSSDEIVNELPVFRQIKEILGRYASKHEVEMTRFFESDVTCTLVNINGNKIIKELQTVTDSFFSVLGMWESSAKPERSKPSVRLRDRLAFEKVHPRFSSQGEVSLPKTPSSQELKGNSLVEVVKLLCTVKGFMNDITIQKLSEKKETVLGIIDAEETQQDRMFTLGEKIQNFSKIVNEINFKDLPFDKDVRGYLAEKLEIIKLCNKLFVQEIFQKVEVLKREKKELAASTDEVLDVTEEAALTLPYARVPGSVPQSEAPQPRAVGAGEINPSLSGLKGLEEKERSAGSKAKKKNAKEGLTPLGYQEESSAERETIRKQKLRNMVEDLRRSWKSLKFRDIQRAVKQLGGTIESNGQDSHYIIRLKHIETGQSVLGATLRRKERGVEYPWWKDTAVDALERAIGLVTDDMSRVFEKIHPKK